MATVIKLDDSCQGYERFRLLDLGVVPGTEIQVALNNPLKDPVAYWIKGAIIALRREQSDKIYVDIMDGDLN
jgi:Fe2+ transport system protein FeoA